MLIISSIHDPLQKLDVLRKQKDLGNEGTTGKEQEKPFPCSLPVVDYNKHMGLWILLLC